MELFLALSLLLTMILDPGITSASWSSLAPANGNTPTPYPQKVQSHPRSTVPVSDYLAGGALDEALAAGEDVVVYWPFLNGCEISNWVQAEALW